MENLIKINRENEIYPIYARELHSFLEVDTRFNDWINRRIDEYGFVENQDFEILYEATSTQGGRPTKDYIICIDMAKELSMIERTEKGKLARKYFIECEKKYKITFENKAVVSVISNDENNISIIEKRNLLHKELCELIKQNLYTGDIIHLASDYEISRKRISAVLNGKIYDYNILNILYEKSIENKTLIKQGLGQMIHNLKTY